MPSFSPPLEWDLSWRVKLMATVWIHWEVDRISIIFCPPFDHVMQAAPTQGIYPAGSSCCSGLQQQLKGVTGACGQPEERYLCTLYFLERNFGCSGKISRPRSQDKHCHEKFSQNTFLTLPTGAFCRKLESWDSEFPSLRYSFIAQQHKPEVRLPLCPEGWGKKAERCLERKRAVLRDVCKSSIPFYRSNSSFVITTEVTATICHTIVFGKRLMSKAMDGTFYFATENFFLYIFIDKVGKSIFAIFVLVGHSLISAYREHQEVEF